MRCMAEMLGFGEKGSPVAVYWIGRVDARRSCFGSASLAGDGGEGEAPVIEVARPVAVSAMA